MNKSKVINAKEILSKRYGKQGSKKRETFTNTALSNYFGDILRDRRKKLKMSQEELAQIVGKKRPYISRVENGEDVRISNLLLLSNALDLKLELSEINHEG